MTKRISLALVTLAAALSGCADWGKIGYLEPGGSPPGASKVSGQTCSASAYTPILHEAVEKALASQSGTTGLKNVEIVLDPGPPTMCATVTGEPLK